MSKLLIAAVSTIALATPAMAQQAAPGPGVDIVHAAARVQVIAENRTDFDVTVTAGARIPAPVVRTQGARIIVDGGLNNRIEGCSALFMSQTPQTARVRGYGTVRGADMPLIVVRAPRTLNLTASGALYSEISASNGGALSFRGCGDANVGAVSGDLDLALSGSGDVRIAPVSGVLAARLDGSGDIDAVSARAAHLTLNGSGDLDVGEVTAGPLTARLDGSGDLEVGRVRGGAVDLRLDGSGDLNVAGGAASHLTARLDGSGDLTFAGRAAEVTAAELDGSGDLNIARADRVLVEREQGSGTLSIGR